MDFKFNKTKRNKDFLIKGVYRFNLHSKNKSGSTIWVCVQEDCTASITMDLNRTNILRENKRHCCIAPVDSCENTIKEIIEKCKKEVCEELIPVQQIFERKFESFACAKHKPIFESYKSTLYRERKSFLESNLKFKSVSDVCIPHVLGNNFLFIDDGYEERIFVFATKFARKQIKDKEHTYFADGTFKSIPPPFFQMYTLHIDYGSNKKATNIHPVIFALLPNKSQTTYTRLFSILKERLNLIVCSFKADYELAALNAVKYVFPEAKISGCYHHYNDAIWRKARELHVTESKFGKKLTSLCASLPLLPANVIEDTWKSIIDDIDENNEFSEFVSYVTKQWMSSITAKVISVAFERHRTTNALEGWHRSINARIPRKPNFHLFLNKLRKEADHADNKVKRSSFVGPKNNRKKCDIEFDRQYKRILKSLQRNEMDPLTALHKIVYLRQPILPTSCPEASTSSITLPV